MTPLYCLVVLVLPLAAYAQDFPPDLCCMPDDYEGFIGEAGCEGEVGESPRMYDMFYRFSYSSTDNKIFWQFSSDPILNRSSVVLDFNQGPARAYTTYLNGECSIETSNAQMNRRCETAFEDRLYAMKKGFPPYQFDAFATYTPDPSAPTTATSFTWSYDCSLIYASTAYSSRNGNEYGSYGEIFMNVTEGIADPSVFDIPTNCCCGPVNEVIASDDRAPHPMDAMEIAKRGLGVGPL